MKKTALNPFEFCPDQEELYISADGTTHFTKEAADEYFRLSEHITDKKYTVIENIELKKTNEFKKWKEEKDLREYEECLKN